VFYILSNSAFKYYYGDFIGLCYDNDKIPDIKPGDVLEMMCPDCNHENCGNDYRNFNFVEDINYKFNNHIFRCDDLDTSKSENNFLFSGCSVTFGMGIPYNKTWPYQVNNHFKGESLFNIGLPAGSFKSIIFDVYAYIRKYGKPKAVFILFPPLLRQPVIRNGKLSTVPYYRNDHIEREGMLKVLNYETMIFEFSRLVQMLEEYLDALNVPFLWGTYEPGFDKLLSDLKLSDNYISMFGSQKAFEYADSIAKSERTDYWLKSRDGHPPVIEHTIFAKVFIDKYGA